jgi:hypothetical protein
LCRLPDMGCLVLVDITVDFLLSSNYYLLSNSGIVLSLS